MHRFLGDDVHIVSTVMVSATVCDMCDVRDMKHRDTKKTETQGGIDIPLRLRFFVFDIYNDATLLSVLNTLLQIPSNTMPSRQITRQARVMPELRNAGSGLSLGVMYIAFTISR